MITLKNIHKQFNTEHNTVVALDGVSIQVDKNDIYGIIGLSGAGKSTLVRCINYLEKPDSGDVIVADKDFSKLSERELRQERKKIGMIFQNFNLLKSKNIFENIAFPLRIDKVDEKIIEEKVDRLLKIVELEDKKFAFPDELSGGQKQRAGIARALANDPDILLCDEATSALDPKTTTQVLSLLKDINHKMGITMVVITHEMQVIKSICNKVAILEYGKVIERGSVIDVFSRKTNEQNSYFLDEHSAMDFSQYNTHLLKLIFVGKSANEPVLSNISRKFDVNFNIIFGKIENIQETNIGRLIVSVDTDKKKIENIINELIKNDVKVEELSVCNE